MSTRNSYSYKDAGVDIQAGTDLVKAIAPLAKATKRPGAMPALGGFGGFFDLKKAGYQDPLLVAATDGVGTKLKLAIEAGLHQGVGIDLVAMCVNDLIVQGAEPLFFLDYYATGQLDVTAGTDIVAGIADGCTQANCALIGGETAEMPGLYQGKDYDLAGFCVGAVEREQVITGEGVAQGDVVLGLASNGLHSNGYSLVRKLLDDHDIDMMAPASFAPDQRLIDILLTPTRIYVRSLLPPIRTGKIKALAHITGGGLLENIPRVLPDHLSATLFTDRWTVPPIFGFLSALGAVTEQEMHKTFNMGIGMVLICAAEEAKAIIEQLPNETVFQIGHIVQREKEPVLLNTFI